MKKLLLVVALFVPVILMAQDSETRKLSSFTEVHASQSIKVTLKKGSSNSAEVITNGDLEDVITEVSGGTLKIEKDQNWNIGSGDRVRVIVTYTEELSELKATSSSSILVEDRLKSDDLELKASSSASIKVAADAADVEIAVSSSADIEADINARKVDARVSSSGSLEMKGQCEDLKAAVSSSGDINAEDFNCKIADLATSSSGRIEVHVEEQMSASASSSGRITYGGQPKIKNMNSSSGGRIRSAD